nr:TPA_asm: m32.6 sORF 2 [Murid betaherpesvirus 1]DBA07957.1 TPA_asm: m32.6 sORF 2 [Murid betaherpesvirus 1]
MYRVGAELR